MTSLMFTVFTNFFSLFFFNDTATTEIYTLSLHDALPILDVANASIYDGASSVAEAVLMAHAATERTEVVVSHGVRSEEHTSELQSRLHLVCRVLLEKKKKTKAHPKTSTRQKKATTTRQSR